MKKLLFVLLATVLFFACKTEAASTTKWTVTIDPNSKTLSGTLSVTVNDGETATLPNDVAAPTDFEIPYYSTSKDDPTTIFKFGETKVTANITVYPHYRYATAKAYLNIVGTWLDDSDSIIFKNIYAYKISADNALNAQFYAREGSTNLDLTAQNNITIRDALLNLAVLPSNFAGVNNTTQTIVNRTISLYNTYQAPLDLAYNNSISDIMVFKSPRFFSRFALLDVNTVTYDANTITISTYSNSDPNTVNTLKLKKLP